MKLSKLASRLANKTGTPELEGVILGERPVEDLPTDCMIWTGATVGRSGKFRQVLTRDGTGAATPSSRRDNPTGIMVVEGKRVFVRRLIYQLLFKPDFEYQMRRQCPEERCVNPLHWKIHTKDLSVHEPEPEPEPEEAETEPPISSDWLQSDVDECLDYALADGPTCWEEVIHHEMFEDNPPPEMVKEALIKANKEHLLP